MADHEHGDLRYGFLANHHVLTKKLDIVALLPTFVAEGLISPDDKDVIEHEVTGSQKTDHFLTILHRRGSIDQDVFTKLYELLSDEEVTAGQRLGEVLRKIKRDSQDEEVRARSMHADTIEWEDKVANALTVREVLPKLFSLTVVNLSEKEAIYRSNDQARELLKIIRQRGTSAFDKFVEVLLEFDTHASLGKQLKERPLQWVVDDKYVKEVLKRGHVPSRHRVCVEWKEMNKRIQTELYKLQDTDGWVVVHDMACSGKSLLAAAAVRDASLLRKVFPDGVNWVTVGQMKNSQGQLDNSKLLSKLHTVILRMDKHKTYRPPNIEAATNHLQQVIFEQHRKSLLILDDVCSSDVAKAFAVRCPTMVTSRNAEVANEVNTPEIYRISVSEGGVKRPYGCGCGECAVSDFVTRRCLNPIPTVNSYPYLDTSLLTEKECHSRERHLDNDFHDINQKYATFTASLRQSLRQQTVTHNDLVDCLMNLSGYEPDTNLDEERSVGLLQDLKKEMENAGNIRAVFKILSGGYCSFFNYDIIAFIVNNLGSGEDKTNLALYELEFEKYCKRPIFECPHYSERNPKFVDLVVKVNNETTNLFTVEALRRLVVNISQVLNVTKHALMVRSVKEGCMEITFQIPSHIYKVALPLSDDQNDAMLSLGVVHPEAQDLYHPQSLKVASESRDPEARFTYSQNTNSPSGHATSKRQVCLRYKLLRECKFKDSGKCSYDHSQIPSQFKPMVDYISVPSSTPSLVLRSLLDRIAKSPEGKAFIAVESDRACDSREIKLVAEDSFSLEFARGYIQKRFTLEPGEEYKFECVKFKLMGTCNYDPCYKEHGDIIESPSIGYVSHLVGKIPNIMKVIDYAGHCKGGGAYLTALSDKNRDEEVKVISENDQVLFEAKKEVELRLCTMHSVWSTGVTPVTLTLRFIHPEGLEIPFPLEMKQCGLKKEYRVEQIPQRLQTTCLNVEEFQHLNQELPHPVAHMLDNPEETSKMGISSQVRLHNDYRHHIHQMLREATMWMHKQQFRPKLEGRFGKLHWSHIPESLHRGSLGMKGFIMFLFRNNKHNRFFKPQLTEASALHCVQTLIDLESVVKSYDIRVTIKNKGKVDIRVKFVDDKPEVMAVRKDEEKVLIGDILCFHRKHDMRLSLSSCDTIPHDDPTIQKFLSHVSLPENGQLEFMPQPQDKEWTVTTVRHKVRRGYLYGKKTYLVTMTTVQTYQMEAAKLCPKVVTVVGNDWIEHHEMEVHNLSWEVDFGRQFGISPEQSLSPLLDPTKIPSNVLTTPARRWTPESIITDFQSDGFLQMMDDINKSID